MSAPVLPRRIRSRPSRNAVPGATAARAARCRSSRPFSLPGTGSPVVTSPGHSSEAAATRQARQNARPPTARASQRAVGQPATTALASKRRGDRFLDITHFFDGHQACHVALLADGAGSGSLRREPPSVGWHYGPPVSQSLRLGEPALYAGHPPDLASEPYLADDHNSRRDADVVYRAGQRHREREVHRWFGEPYAANGGRINVTAPDLYTSALRKHGEDHPEPGAIEAGSDPPRHVQHAGGNERLHLSEQRPAPFERDGDARAWDRVGSAGQEQAAWVGQADEPELAQLEAAKLVSRAEPVLYRTHHPQPAVPVALEMQHHVHQVLQRSRSGDRTFLGHVADEHGGQTALFGDVDQRGRDLAHLRHASGRAVDALGRDGLYGIDDQQFRLDLLDLADDRGEPCLGGEVEVRRDRADPVGARPNLCGGLFGRHIQDRA